LNVSYGGSDGGSAFMLCDAENGDSLKSFFELNSKYSTFEFSPDDTRLVIGFNNHRLLVLSDCFDSLKMTTATDSTVRAIHFSGDGTRFLTLTRDTVVTIRNTDSLERVRKISKKESILST
jgi:WD40 repeat protein